MAIAFENSATANADFASSLTLSFNAGTNADRCVLVFATTDRGGATTISSATYGGVSMTAGTAFTSASGYDGRLFYLGGAASGANNLVVTYSDGNTKPKLAAVAYSGVDGTTPLSGLTNGGAFNASPTWTVTSATGETVVVVAMQNGRTAVTATSPATERLDAQCGTTVFYGFAFEEAGASSVTIDGSATGGSTEWWGTAGSLKAASSGITGTASLALDAVTSSASGAVALAGALNKTLDNVTTTAAGTVALAGALAKTLADVTTTAAGAVALAGAAAQTLADVTTSAAGTVALAGQAALTLDAVALAADATVVSGRTGAAAITLGGVTTTASGAVAIAGTATPTLGNVTTTAASVLALTGAAAIVIDGITLAASTASADTEPGRMRLGYALAPAAARRLGLAQRTAPARRLGLRSTGG